MRAVRSKDTAPELIVRRIAHRLGYRYRLHPSELPGKPDLVFRSRRKVIFVHGCFWHRHRGCARATLPQSNKEFWQQKLESNAKRDSKQVRALQQLGWEALIIWQCETKNTEELACRLKTFLSTSS